MPVHCPSAEPHTDDTALMEPLLLEPAGPSWIDRAREGQDQVLWQQPLATWRSQMRAELQLDADRPMVATGHQTLLWHPGILAKYLAVEAATASGAMAGANLVVDQHVDAFGTLAVPVRDAKGELGVHALRLTTERPSVPMSAHAAFDPAAPSWSSSPASSTVEAGVQSIINAIAAHRDAGDAATQMASALGDLMQRWVRPLPAVTASSMLRTTLGQRLLEHMANDPIACGQAYNAAVAGFPEAGIPELSGAGDDIEVPLWRAGENDVRTRATVADLRCWLNDGGQAPLYPRALLLTALVRLGLCDLFVHGTGGANYDRAMEVWINTWLGVEPAPVAVVSATLRLPLLKETIPPDTAVAIARARHGWHDPEVAGTASIRGSEKLALVKSIDAAPRGSARRREQFFSMHERLVEWRRDRTPALDALRVDVERSRALGAQRDIALRRDWPFPLYDVAALDGLAAEMHAKFAAE